MHKLVVLAAVVSVAAPALTSCANTIRGAGRDTAQTVNATQSAVKRTGRAVVN